MALPGTPGQRISDLCNGNHICLLYTSNGVPVAMLCFGINSGAYVAEIIRAGIMSVDNGQSEACLLYTSRCV